MNAAEPLTEEAALWASVNEMPTDQLRRLVLADWYEERACVVKCGECDSGALAWAIGDPEEVIGFCIRCSGIGYVSNGFADTAAALRATCANVPVRAINFGNGFIPEWRWFRRDTDAVHGDGDLPPDVFDALAAGELNAGGWCYFYRPVATAADAIRDLCRAWVKVNREGTA